MRRRNMEGGERSTVSAQRADDSMLRSRRSGLRPERRAIEINLKAERRAEDKQPRIDDPICTGGAIRRSGDGLKPPALIEISHVELDRCTDLVREERRAIPGERIEIIAALVVDRIVAIEGGGD